MSLFKSIGGKVTEVPGTSRRKASAISRLVDVYRKLERMDYRVRHSYKWDFIEFWRPKLYLAIKEGTKEIDYSPENLQNFALALSDIDVGSFALKGAYVGGLVNQLTERSGEELVEVKFDLGGKYFPYFCFATENAGNLYIANIKGDYVASSIARYNGSTNLVSVKNCDGDYVTSSIARHNGSANLVSAQNCNGNNVASWIASFVGSANLVSVQNCNGNNVASSIAHNCLVDLLSTKEVTGMSLLTNLENVKHHDREGIYTNQINALVKTYLANPNSMDLDSEIKELLASVNGGALR